MNIHHTLNGHVLTPEGFVRGALHIEGGRIASIEGLPVTEAAARADTRTPLLLPGFIDLHVHGGGGADTMDAGSAARTLARLHAQHGTTALLATTMTAPLSDIEAALHALAPAVAQRESGAARLLGACIWKGPTSALTSWARSRLTRAGLAWKVCWKGCWKRCWR
jgi:N-acetylglucosamine-6-phosphate deacetylase